MVDEAQLDARLRGYVEEFGGVAGSVHTVHRDDLLLVAQVNLPAPLRAAVAVIPRGKGMAGTAWLRGEPLQSCDLKTDTAGGVVQPGARAVGAGAAVALPVRGADGEVVGVVGIAFDEEREIPEPEIRVLTQGAAGLFAGPTHRDGTGEQEATGADASVLDGMRAKARAWLLARQDASGAWLLPLRPGVSVPSVAMTVLALTALDGDSGSGGDHHADAERADAFGRGLAWLAERQNPDGSFGDGEGGRFYRPYCTALALWVLPSGGTRYATQIARAVDCLRVNQRPDGLDRGGIGHGMIAPAPTPQDPQATFTRTFAMISPTSMAADGMRRVGVVPGDPFLEGVADYVRSCQNDPAVNSRPAVERFILDGGFRLTGDGGIIATLENLRRPWKLAEPEAGARAGTGAMPEPVVASGISTFQGLSAYLHAGLPVGSPEVAGALRWIRDHYSVTEHAGFGDVVRAGQRPTWPTEHGGFDRSGDGGSGDDGSAQADDMAQAGWYLYAFSMAQALDAAGLDVIETSDGARHAWRAELGEALRAAQSPDGFWSNPNPRWLEFDAALSTAFALSTVNVLARRGRRPAGPST